MLHEDSFNLTLSIKLESNFFFSLQSEHGCGNKKDLEETEMSQERQMTPAAGRRLLIIRVGPKRLPLQTRVP